jgi:RimJ/RimL family protein N-acetyltransferase
MTSAALGPITADDAVLRMLGEDDLPLTRAWRNHPESRHGFHSSEEITAEQHRAWFAGYRERADDYVFIMEVAGRPVAQSALYDIVPSAAEFGRLLVDPGERGRGLSHRIIALTQDAAVALGLDELYLQVKRANRRAIRAYERAGFARDPQASGRDDALVMRWRRP